MAIFDRCYNRLARLRLDRPPAVLNPRAPITPIELRFFYEDATAPYIDPETLPLIQHVAKVCGLGDEHDLRWASSGFGRIPHWAWTKNFGSL
jgi:hypothetical protein